MFGWRRGSDITKWHVSHVVCLCVAALLAVMRAESMTMEVEDGSQDCVIIEAKKGNTINANYEILSRPVEDTMVILRHKLDDQLLYKKEEVEEDLFRAQAPEDGDYELCFINGDQKGIKTLRNQYIPEEINHVGMDALVQQKKAKLKAEHQEEPLKRDAGDQSSGYSSTFYSIESTDVADDDFMLGYYGQNSRRKIFGFGLRLGEDVDNLEAEEHLSEDKKMANFLREEADLLLHYLSVFDDHESYMRGREEFHRENVNQTSSRLMWCTFIEAAVLAWVSWSQLSYIRRFFETKRVL